MKKTVQKGIVLLLLIICVPLLTVRISSATLDPAASPAAAKKEEKKEAPAPTPAPVQEPAQEPAPAPPDGQTYDFTMESSVGTLTYYCQGDARWANAIYGGSDSIAGYGCGPTALAMLVESFTETPMTPPEMAAWASQNGYWYPGSGSVHSLIPEGAAAFGLTAEPFQDFTEEGVKKALREGHILVALMGSGHFTQNGHFIIIADYYSGSQVTIADPASAENTQIPWDINLILSELNPGANNGGPIWRITPH